MKQLKPFEGEQDNLPAHIKKMLCSLKNDLLSLGGVQCVVLFGSYAKGTYHKNSDIDIAVFVLETDEAFLHRQFCMAQRIALKYRKDIQIMLFPAEMLENPLGIIEEITEYGREITAL